MRYFLNPGSIIDVPPTIPNVCCILHYANTFEGRIAVIYAFGVMPKRNDVPVKVSIQTLKTPYGTVLRLLLIVFDDVYNPLRLEVIMNPMDRETQEILKLIYDGPQRILPIVFAQKIDVDKAMITDMMAVTISEYFKEALKMHLKIAIRENEKIEKYDFEKARSLIIENIPL